MRSLMHQEKSAVGGPIQAALPQVPNQFEPGAEHADGSADADLSANLRHQLAVHGVSVAGASGGYLLNGAGVCQVGDARAAWSLLRQMRRAYA
jgi:hypothetical protein